MKKNILLLMVFSMVFTMGTFAQGKVKYSEEQMPLMTYPFSNPDPVPEVGRIYPYFSFNNYAAKGEMQNHKMVVLENDYIKLWITPEIGGKIWGAIEKSTGREFIYFNHAAKFRDIAMRGPWTSGGLEFNYGVIGHAPSCSSPVDYLVRENKDGSVSCYVGAVDLPSSTRWSVEINLQPDKAYFTTRSLWDNSGMTEQSYYHWTNLGIKTAGNLEYAFPGNYFLGHDGKASPWPISKEGRDLHFYENNNFGSYKSYHVFGEVTSFYGGFWLDDNFGFGHFANYDEKPGKKLWIWGLSDQGMIWEDLLTDKDGQYTELQSGRLFNQEASESTFSPFKHKYFAPGSTDEWIEYWFPVKGTNGVKTATPQTSLNLAPKDGKIVFSLCPNQPLKGTVEIKAKLKTVYTAEINLGTLQLFSDSFNYANDETSLSVWINNVLFYEADPEKLQTKRPFEMPADFNWDSSYGHFMKGNEWHKQRFYAKAEEEYQKSLALEQWFVPALNRMASISYRKLDYPAALKYAQNSLSVDTYDPDANVKYALSSLALGDTVSAIDGFSMASAQVSVRSAAYNGLATIFMRKRQYDRSLVYSEKSLENNALGVEATQSKVMSLLKLGKIEDARKMMNEMQKNDPLNHFVRFETWLENSTPENKNALEKYITNEFPVETYLTYALWYLDKGFKSDAIKILDIAPESPIVLFWKAYLMHVNSDSNTAKSILDKAVALSPELIFPYRPETLKPLKWAQLITDSWKIKYYKGLILLNAGATDEGSKEWFSCAGLPDYYPFYIARSGLSDIRSEQAEADVKKALQLSGGDWRTGLFASRFYLEKRDTTKSFQIIKDYSSKDPKNYSLGLQYAKMLGITGDFSSCVNLLKNLNVLPNEGATEGRTVWRNANIGMALNLMEASKYKKATESIDLARQFPRNLGVGRPYEVDERLEDFISLLCYKHLNDNKSVEYLQKKISSASDQAENSINENDFISAWVLKSTGNAIEGDRIMKELRSKNPESLDIQWCDAIYSGKNQEAKKMTGKLKNGSGLIQILIRVFAMVN